MKIRFFIADLISAACLIGSIYLLCLYAAAIIENMTKVLP